MWLEINLTLNGIYEILCPTYLPYRNTGDFLFQNRIRQRRHDAVNFLQIQHKLTTVQCEPQHRHSTY